VLHLRPDEDRDRMIIDINCLAFVNHLVGENGREP
jgi:hypothetical protein